MDRLNGNGKPAVDELAVFRAMGFGAADEELTSDQKIVLVFRKEGVMAVFLRGPGRRWDSAGFRDVATGLHIGGRSGLRLLVRGRLGTYEEPHFADGLATMLKAYGKPDVRTTDKGKPWPRFITTRLVYRKQRVQAVLVCKPPGKWELAGFEDAATQEPISQRAAVAALRERLRPRPGRDLGEQTGFAGG